MTARWPPWSCSSPFIKKRKGNSITGISICLSGFAYRCMIIYDKFHISYESTLSCIMPQKCIMSQCLYFNFILIILIWYFENSCYDYWFKKCHSNVFAITFCLISSTYQAKSESTRLRDLSSVIPQNTFPIQLSNKKCIFFLNFLIGRIL